MIKSTMKVFCPTIALLGLMLTIILQSGCGSLLQTRTNGPIIVGTEKDSEIKNTFKQSELLLNSARKFEQAGQVSESIKLYEKLTTIDDSKYLQEAHRHLAVLYALAERDADADQMFKLALDDNPNDIELLNDYGYFLYQNRKYQTAIGVFEKALQLNPRHQKAQSNLAIAFVSAGDTQAGYEKFQELVGEPDALANVGAILMRNNQESDAVRWLSRAKAKGSQHGTALLRQAKSGSR